MGHPGTLVFFTLLAVVELIADKLPKTPPRTAPPGLIARIVFGGLCGVALAISAGGSLIIAAIVGVIGAPSVNLAVTTSATTWSFAGICPTSAWHWLKT